jgi:hypothetical protein
MPNETRITEQEIRSHIVENETEDASDKLLQVAGQYEFPELEDKLSLVSSNWETYESNKLTGTASFEDLNEEKSRIESSVLSLNRVIFEKLNRAGEAANPAIKEELNKKGISEDKFKTQVFVLMLLSKIIIIGWIFHHKSTGGLSSEHALSIIALLLPVLSVYLGAMFDDFLKDKYISEKKKASPFVKNSVKYITYFLFFTYTLLILNVIGNQATGEYCSQVVNVDGTDYCIGLETMNKWIGLIESGLGIYLGKIVFSFFKKEKA